MLNYINLFKEIYPQFLGSETYESLLPLANKLQDLGIKKFDSQRSFTIRQERELNDNEKAEWWLGELIDIVVNHGDNYIMEMTTLMNFGKRRDQLLN